MDHKYRVGCSIENLKGVRDFIRLTLKEYEVPDLQISEMVLALDEMCSNLMIHAHHCNPDDLFELKIHLVSENIVVFEIIDDHSAFDINAFSTPDLGNLVHEKRKGGLGIRLVKTIMDKIEYQTSDGKNICRLSKRVQIK